MLSTELQEEISQQIGREFYSAYVYLGMAAHCELISLPGFGRWLRTQSKEEVDHGMRLYRFLIERQGRVTLPPLAGPATEFASLSELFEKALEHERAMTANFNCLYETAINARDYATQAFLNWFVTEQVEEEALVNQILETLRRVDERGDAVVLLDKELGSRGAQLATATSG
jgi:ferritin